MNSSNKTSHTYNPATVYLATLAPSGRRSMQHQLKSAIQILGSDAVVEEFKWGKLSYADIIKIRSDLLDQQKSVYTVNLCLSAIKGVAQCAFHLGMLTGEELLHIKAVKRVPCKASPTGRSLSSCEIKRLFTSCQKDKSILSIRDTALIAVMISTGLRRAEMASLMLANYDDKTGQITVKQTKGNKDRICYLPSMTRRKLSKWIAKRGVEPGVMFCRIRKNGKVDAYKLSTQTIYNIVRNRAIDAGLGKLTPHDLRRSFITRLLESNIDIHTVSQLVGHGDISTTSRYDLRILRIKDITEKIFS